MAERTWGERVGRRSFLRAGAVLASGVVATGTVGADQHAPDPSEPPKTGQHDVHWGESNDDGGVWTYATTDESGELSSLGVHIDSAALDAFGESPVDTHLHFPEETEAGDELDTHQFTFLGLDYTPEGHPPPEVYTVPHLDVHFYMVDEEEVHDISGGPLADAPFPFIGLADYEIPDAQFPEGYQFDVQRFIVERMGEHLLDPSSPEFHDEEFTHTHVYGAHDPSIDFEHPDRFETVELQGECVDLPVYEGDGEGQIHFYEPMVTTDFLRNELDDEVVVDVATPDEFVEEDDYPTAYVLKPDGDGGAYVAVDDFEAFPGASGSASLSGTWLRSDNYRTPTGLRGLRF